MPFFSLFIGFCFPKIKMYDIMNMLMTAFAPLYGSIWRTEQQMLKPEDNVLGF